MSEIKIKKTPRGFSMGKFTDFDNQNCKIQKSSLATEDCIWLGVESRPPQIMCSDAIRLGLRRQTNSEADNGWCDYPLPDGVLQFTKMHLTREQVKELLPLLKRFVKTGEL